jgi:hypothetical protein
LKYNGLEFQIVSGIILGKKQYILRDISGNECVNIIINEENKLYLSTLQYRPSCTVDRAMKKGESTMFMLKGILKFVLEHEPLYNEIYFVDESTFDCPLVGDGYTITISLPYNNFILYGKTWYERHFEAEITRQKLKEQMETSLLSLNSIVKKDEGYDDILSQILEIIKRNHYPKYEELKREINNCFEHALTGATTWMALFYELFSSEGTLSRRMGKGNNYSCTLFNSTRDIYYIFSIPTFAYVPMKLRRTTIELYPGAIEYIEEVALDDIYRGGSKSNQYGSYPYYRDCGNTGTCKKRDYKQFNKSYTMMRYFDELPWKQRKTRRKHE